MHPITHLLRTLLAIAFTTVCHAAVVTATPATYPGKVRSLKPGDTLNLEQGTYRETLNLSGMQGSAEAWITIQGPADGSALFTDSPTSNTVELSGASYIAVRHLTLDGRGTSSSFAVSAKGGDAVTSHDILIEGLTIRGFDGSQQTSAISTKCTAWNWKIRGNRILSSGTGLYLGNSDGGAPFINGVVEGNLIQSPIGYCMQIKHQRQRPVLPGMPATGRTIIRDNVFQKGDRASPDGDRPNVLIGGLPDAGAGANDLYEIYGNLFVHNPREALLQVSGRFTIHDNILLDVPRNVAIDCVKHAGKPVRLAHIYNNTVLGAGVGIHFGSPADASAVVANLVFAGNPLSGAIAGDEANICGSIADAARHLVDANQDLSKTDAYPRAGMCRGPAYSLAAMAGETASDVDFNGRSKAPLVHRGAYAGSGVNPGWHLALGLKETPKQGVDGKLRKRISRP